MPLSAGTRLGPYEIVAPLGAGGMGEVYRARDTKLGREVAIKVLPESLASDPERLARFNREAQVLAALNHSNIAHIHGLEDSTGVPALVMELVEGPTLADRIRRGPIPIDEALAIARQIVDALEAAHEQGIIHRDLKPANVKVREDGTVKVLDFGLAKALEPVEGSRVSSGAAGVIQLPTITSPAMMTEVGVILGTAAYMSPEQAKGYVADKRADIWGFGVLVYEMITGRQAFAGETVSDTLASVLKEQPTWDRVPAQARRLLRSCLEKDPKRRLRDIGDARLLLQDASAPGDAVDARRSPRLAWAVAALFIISSAVLGWLHFREPLPPDHSVWFQVVPPESSPAAFRLSPDGRYLAMIVREGGRNRLWVRRFASPEGQFLSGTDGANFPFWSPDSAFIGFVAQANLMRVSVTGGPAETLCEATPIARATWGRDGVIVFAPGPGKGLQRVSTAGGCEVVALTTPRPGESHYVPAFLPDGRGFLYTVVGGRQEHNGIFAASLDGTPAVRLLPDASRAAYVPPAGARGIGHLLFVRGDTLMAQPFDSARLRMVGEVFPVAEQVGSLTSPVESAFSASESGVLAFAAWVRFRPSELVWMDRSSQQIASAAPPGFYQNARLAGDDKRIAFDRSEGTRTDIWVRDLPRGVTSQLTFTPEIDNMPIWSPEGSRVLFASRGGGSFGLYVKTATGANKEELLVKIDANGWATNWSQDGRFILYAMLDANGGRDLWIAPQFGDRKPFAYLQSPFNEDDGVFSPDGRWIAYVSNESAGRDEVYVQSFPLSDQKWQISTDGGSDPTWRADGSELFYLAADRKLIAVPVRVGAPASSPDFGPGVPVLSIPGTLVRRSYAVSSDGKRFLVPRPIREGNAPPINVVVNWQAALRK